MNSIHDHIRPNLDILFIGFNPSIRSGHTGFHYASPNNRFWRILHEIGLTPRKYDPSENAELLELGMGLTNIVSRPTKSAAEITKQEYEQGREELKKKIQTYMPCVVCFVGKGVYQQYSKRSTINWGVQNEQMVEGTIDFVAPSSSGLVRMKMDEILEIYRQLPALLEEKENRANND